MNEIARTETVAVAPWLARLEHICVLATRPVASIGVAGMLLGAAATVLDVLLRWFFNSPLPALNEVIAMLFAVAITATLPAGLANKVNLRIDLLTRFMTRRLGLWLDAIGGVFLLAFFLVLTWQIEVYAGQLAAQGRATVMLGLPEAPFVYTMTVLLGIACVVQLVVTLNQVAAAMADRAPAAVMPAQRAFTW